MIKSLLLIVLIIALAAIAELIPILLAGIRERRRERDFLDRVARDYGLERRRGESNEALRFRLRHRVAGRGGGATLQGLIATAGEVRGVERVFVVDEGPSMLSMYIEPNDPDVVARVREALRDEVVAGLDLNVQGAGADDAA